MSKPDPFGIYLHIPFCKRKCPYCDFFSGKADERDYDSYTSELANQIACWGSRTKRVVTTVYFGGGTPSVLGAERLAFLLIEIRKHFAVSDNAEITAEVNPDTGRSLDFSLLRSAGFNRISVGMQSAIPQELKALGRIHSIEGVQTTVRRAQSAGIDNLSLDLMMGIPLQTIDSLKESIRFCADCGVKHISAYILKIEEGTPFAALRNTLDLADDEQQAQMYLAAVDYLEQLGYRQYEISNFALEGYESRHNSAYWKCCEYIGIGPSAHSFFEGKRFYYGRSMDDFRKNIITDDGVGGDQEEFIMLSLRLKSGLNFQEYHERYGSPLSPIIMQKLKRYAQAGFMEVTDESACFTPKGFLVSNTIISDLL